MFDEVKRIVPCNILLAYPNTNKRFDVHTDAINCQLGAMISQGGKPIAFYSHKLTGKKTWYTETEKEIE